GEEGALYDLIWKRTVATQMAEARLRLVTVTIEAGERDEVATFRASGKTILFPGFFRAYVEGSDDPDAALEDREQPLPDLKEGDRPSCREVEPLGRQTRPPARYTEATLIKELEKQGIGRPSTYATIIDTIVERGYAFRQKNQLVPTFTAFATNNLLEARFARLVDLGFTARMEQALDDIAAGQQHAVPYLRDFYFGDEGLDRKVREALDSVDPREVSAIHVPKWGPYTVRVGKYGPYVEGEVDGERRTASLPEKVVPDEVTKEMLEGLLRASINEQGPLGTDPATGLPVYVLEGPYGPYVQLGDKEGKPRPRRVSLPKGMAPDEVTLETALDLLALPRTLGQHPETGEPVLAGIGRYGPFVQHGSTYASLQPGDDVLTIDLPRALELLTAKEARRGGTKKVLRELGPHPETGEMIVVMDGRYGPYVKHQRVNASLPKDRKPEDITLEEALSLLEERTSRSGKRRSSRAKKA
ncbi:MAG: DNA topoisomerase I, partial [Bacteroidetes bacterium]